MAWAARLQAEAEPLRAATGIDPARPRAAAEPAWRFATGLAAPLQQARQEQRPVLVFFESDWCRWCKRLDLHTFADAEVAALMERFACVRLNYDFMASDDYERVAGRGLPLLLLLDADGRPLDRTARSPRDPCRTARLECFEAPQVFARR
ncbi:MAG: thioredoxin family protein, partial [Planctomycetia bacterium]